MSYALMGANTFALSQFRSPAYNFNVDVVQWEELLFSGSKRAVVA